MVRTKVEDVMLKGRKNIQLTKAFRVFVDEPHKMISGSQIQVTEIILHLKKKSKLLNTKHVCHNRDW